MIVIDELANEGQKINERVLRAMVAQAGLEFCQAHEVRIRALVGGRSSAWCRLSAGPEKHRRGQVQRRGRRCQGCDAVAQ